MWSSLKFATQKGCTARAAISSVEAGANGPNFMAEKLREFLGEGCSYVARCCVVCHAGCFQMLLGELGECAPAFGRMSTWATLSLRFCEPAALIACPRAM